MNKDKIASVLGLRPLEEAKRDQFPDVINQQDIQPPEIYQEEEIDNDETIKDIELARKNIENIIKQGDETLKEMIAIAKQSESPRAFEVVSGLMKTLLDANKDFVEMSTKKKYAKEEIRKPKETVQTNVTNNNLIISTADLLKMIRGK
jgi:hypothetical protein